MDSSLETVDGVLVIDVDGTLCEIKVAGQDYADVAPKAAMIERIREYKAKGYRILLFTSRNMRTFNNNVGLVNKHTAPVLLEWLEKWNVPYDEILFGKPWPMRRGFYIDDRAIRPDEFLALSEEEIQALLGQD